MIRTILLLSTLAIFSCKSMGIKLNEIKTNPILNSCTRQSEIRSYKILFLLPFLESQISEEKAKPTDSIQSISDYAKPWDIGFTILGFLFSLTSSTQEITYCTEAETKKILPAEKLSIALPHYKWLVGSKPSEQIVFAKDDSLLGDSEKAKLTPIVQALQNSSDKFHIILVGKTNSSGDIAFQTRLTKRRAEEIKSMFTSLSFDSERIQTVFSETDLGGSDSVSTISIFLVKE